MAAKEIIRDGLGLLDGVQYIYDEFGRINWRKMIRPEFLVFNVGNQEQIEKTYGKPLTELSITEVDDKYLLILLGGIKELARLRGFHSVEYKVIPASERAVSATCHIEWIPNFETENRSIIFGDGADATIENTTGFGKSFLTTIAINRAFVRAVRNFLGINIVGSDEISSKPIPQEEKPVDAGNVSVHAQLQRSMQAADLDFETVKKTCVKSDKSAEEWESLIDIPLAKALDLIGRIDKKAKK